MIDYNKVLDSLKNASLFDLYRLGIAISNEMENPDRIKNTRNQFCIGDKITYLSKEKNAQFEAIVLEKNIKYVLIKKCVDGNIWQIPYYAINLDGRDINISNKHKEKLTKNHLKVGEFVGFNHDGEQIVGVITRLNHKTVSLVAQDHRRWRVGYGCLFKVLDANVIAGFQLPASLLIEPSVDSSEI